MRIQSEEGTLGCSKIGWRAPPRTRSQISDVEVSGTAHNAGRVGMSVRGVSKLRTSVTGDYCVVFDTRDL